jgi:hypothetical protein
MLNDLEFIWAWMLPERKRMNGFQRQLMMCREGRWVPVPLSGLTQAELSILLAETRALEARVRRKSLRFHRSRR